MTQQQYDPDKMYRITYDKETGMHSTPVFTSKLDELPSTIETALAGNETVLGRILLQNDDKSWIAVGSGGSYVAAYHFMYVMSMHGRTVRVSTPMSMAYTHREWVEGRPVVVFSATGRSPDTLGAIYAARRQGASRIVLITCNEALEQAKDYEGVEVVVVDSIDHNHKDGFLATHSLIATSIAVMRALDETGQWTAEYEHRWQARIARGNPGDGTNRNSWRRSLSELTEDTRLFLLWEPLANGHPGILLPLLHTCITEAGLCVFTSDDLRRFAHGKHASLFGHGNRMVIGNYILRDEAFSRTAKSLDDIMRLYMEHERYKAYLSAPLHDPAGVTLELLDGLVMIEAMGQAVGIDPGKVEVANAGREIYRDTAFRDEQKELLEKGE